jgi:hypothetical protein
MFDVVKYNLLNLKIEECIKKFEGKLTYVGTWDIGYGFPSAVFYNAIPNRNKNHKDFMILSKVGKNTIVSGKDWIEMSKNRKVNAIRCLSCQEMIYSAYVHHYNTCNCKKSFIDGGMHYIRCNIDSEVVQIDMLAKFEGKNEG